MFSFFLFICKIKRNVTIYIPTKNEKDILYTLQFVFKDILIQNAQYENISLNTVWQQNISWFLYKINYKKIKYKPFVIKKQKQILFSYHKNTVNTSSIYNEYI